MGYEGDTATAKDVTAPRDATRGRRGHEDVTVSSPTLHVFYQGPLLPKPIGSQLAKEPGKCSVLHTEQGRKRQGMDLRTGV